jgi:transcription factor 1
MLIISADDIIKYLAPTLEPYKGCTIIDVNPGACLWSSKLHDFLKPKRHILMEPEPEYMEAFLRPLLEAPGSTYRHTDMFGAHPREYWPNYAKLLTDGQLMPPRETLAPGDSRSLGIDHSLLVTGNLVRRFDNRVASKKVRFAELTLQHMTWAALTGDLFHTHGPVRMLWWCSDWVTSNVVPKNMTAASTFNVAMSVCGTVTPVVECPRVQEIVRQTGPNLGRQETPSMVEEFNNRLRANMEGLGMSLPENRKVFWTEANAFDGRPGFKSPYTFDCQSIAKLTAAIATTENLWKRFRTAIAMVGSPREEEYKLMVAELRYPQVEGLVLAAAKISHTQNYYKLENGRRRCMIFTDIFLAVIHLEVNYKELEEKMTTKSGETASDGNPSLPDDLRALRERIVSLGDTIDENSKEIYPNYRQITEDQLAMFADPPRGNPHKRAFPSLQASPKDFLLSKAMSLLDFMPRTVDYTVPGLASRHEACATAQEILKAIFVQRGTPLLQRLESLAPNASTDLLPFLPTLHDPRKGGRLNPHQVVVRQVSDEMVDELVQAWYEWPFRPPHGQLTGGSRGEGEVLGVFDQIIDGSYEEEEEDFDY